MSRRPPRKPPTITPMYFNNTNVLPVRKQTMFIRYLTYLYDLENSPVLSEGKPQHRWSDLLFSFLNSEKTSAQILQRYTSAVTLCQRFSSISNMSLFPKILWPRKYLYLRSFTQKIITHDKGRLIAPPTAWHLPDHHWASLTPTLSPRQTLWILLWHFAYFE